MARRKKQAKRHIPVIGERVLTPDGPARTIDVNRPAGIICATVRLEDKELQAAPDGGMRSYPCREIEPYTQEEADRRLGGGVERTVIPGANPPLYTCVVTIGTKLASQYDAGVHAARCGCDGRKHSNLAMCETWPSYERSLPKLVQDIKDDLARADGVPIGSHNIRVFDCAKKAHRRMQDAARKAAAKTASGAKSQDLQGQTKEQKPSLQSKRRSGKLHRATVPKPTKGGPIMAKTATRSKGRGSRAKASEAKETKASNGNGRRTHEDILELVPEIVKKLKDGTTMTDIRAEYGAGPVIRKALAESGYNTKGEKIDVEDLTDLTGKKLAAAVAELREEGRAWYYVELATDMSQADLQDLLEEHGYKHLATGRVSVAQEEEVEEAPKRSRSKTKASGSGKSTRGKAKAEEAEEEAPARRRGGRRRRQSNPS